MPIAWPLYVAVPDAVSRWIVELLEATRRHPRVRLGASTGALAHLLPQALTALAAQHPEIDVQVAVVTSEEALARLAAGRLDIGIVALPQPATRGLRVQACGDCHLMNFGGFATPEREVRW